MGRASYAQASFLGGEWSEFAQGRFDRPDYKTGLSTCLNAYPVEEGAWTRRPGERFLATTRNGVTARLIPYDFRGMTPYIMEHTAGHMRLFGNNATSPLHLATTNDDKAVVSISTATPAVATIEANTWATGDQVFFNFSNNTAAAFCPLLRLRQFSTVRLSSTTIALYDPVTGAAIDGSALGWGTGPGSGRAVSVARVQDIVTPYVAGDLPFLRAVQSSKGLTVLRATKAPQFIRVTEQVGSGFAQFDLDPATFLDGPYLDPVANRVATPTGTSGDITLDIAGTGSFVFAATDVGRHVRLFSEPLAWDAGTAYAAGDTVSWNGTYYIAIDATTGKQPDININDWQISAAAALWTWGTVKTYTDPTTVVVTLLGGDLLYSNDITIWRMGVFSDTTGYPACGTYHEGRLWLSGSVPNRIDGGVSNGDDDMGNFNFSPTAPDGTVADNNGISYIFNATDQNIIYWMQPTSQGIVCGTQAGEWLVQASALNDPLTPTSIQAHRVTRYGCANVEPKETGLTIVFVQRWARKLYEYFADVFSSRFSAPNLSWNAGHLVHEGISELAFQRERTPVVWSRTPSGKLLGLTYKRDNLYSAQGPSFAGWHKHELGSGRTLESIAAGASQFSNLDGLMMVTNDASGVRHIGVFTDLFDEGDLLTSAWFLDDAVVPSGGVIDGPNNTVTFHGLWHLNGKTVTAFVGGLDAGDAVVSNGSMTVPFGDGLQKLFSPGYLASISGHTISNAPGAVGLSVSVDIPTYGDTTSYNDRYSVPVVVGFTYRSRGQKLPIISPEESGAKNGPALGKLQRQDQIAFMLVNTVTGTLSIGGDFDHLRVQTFKTKGDKNVPITSLYSDVWWATLDDTSGFGSSVAWEISRPLPATITALGGFISTEDR